MQNTHESHNSVYTSRFFSGVAPGALRSARVVLGMLFEVYRPKSVLDVGCGHGSWLVGAEELGAERLVGIDGPWVDPNSLLRNTIEFSSKNLEQDFADVGKFDLCISVEVAEHLSPKSAENFVQNLCASAEVIVFSAAIPLQGGTNHINEQWQSYWAKLFAARGFDTYDFFRPKLWNEQQVESWYRQNLLLYVKRSHPAAAKFREGSPSSNPLDLVHPEIFEGNLESLQRPIQEPSLKFCAVLLGRWFRRQLRKLRPSN